MHLSENGELRKLLDKETPILSAEIRDLYGDLDRKFGLHAAKVPISFGYEEDLLGSYTPSNGSNMEHFHFSLLFVGYALPKPLKKEDRLDLYKHEYAHYMQYHMTIPSKYKWQPGIHGSAWKYCCSLVGAAPTPYYKVGESLMQHNYDDLLRDRRKDPTRHLEDHIRQEKQYQDAKNSRAQYQPGDLVMHQKFGEGIVEEVEPLAGSVRLSIRFGSKLKKIDQKWLLRSAYQKSNKEVKK